MYKLILELCKLPPTVWTWLSANNVPMYHLFLPEGISVFLKKGREVFGSYMLAYGQLPQRKSQTEQRIKSNTP